VRGAFYGCVSQRITRVGLYTEGKMTDKKIILGAIALICIVAVGIFFVSNSIGSGVDIPEEKRKVYIHSISLHPGNYSNVDGNNVRGEILLYLSYHCPYYGLKSYEDIKWYIDDEYVGSSFPVKWDTALCEDGIHKVRVEATNVVGYTGKKEISVDVDNTGPWVDIEKPSNGSILHGMITLEADIDGYGSELEEVNWYLDDTKIGSGKETVWGAYGLEGTHTLKVVARDKLGNENSKEISVNLVSPDLVVENVTVSDVEPEVRDVVGITAEIRNEGSVGVDEINVTFYVDGNVIYSEILSLSGGSNSMFFEWTVGFGEHVVSVLADPDNDIIESNYRNNLVNVEVNAKPKLTENCGGKVNCKCDEDKLCGCSECHKAEDIAMKSLVKCNTLNVVNEEHALYRIDATENAAAYLLSPGDNYGLYTVRNNCSGDESHKNHANVFLLERGIHYLEVRKIRESGNYLDINYFELYIDADHDKDGIPDAIDSDIVISECSSADVDGNNEVNIIEVTNFISLWRNDVVESNEIVDAIDKWNEGCSQGTLAAPQLIPTKPDNTLAVASRATPESAYPGTTITITLNIDIDEVNLPSAILISEDIPRGWKVVDSNPKVDKIMYKEGGEKIEWLFSDAVNKPVEDTTITYALKIPSYSRLDIGRLRGWIFYMDQRMYVHTTTGFSDIEMLSYECTSGPCCDPKTDTYRNSSYMCDEYHDVDFSCPWGSEGDVGINCKRRYCSGNNSACDGVITGWSGWQSYEDCYEDEVCDDGDCVVSDAIQKQ